ncbi:MAG: hypothetical protein K2Y05_01600 [Hyphomicrobiaceae bacterium]|nr:hypothetical protein [Hyphomicrobiaceae bacterium]
MRMVLVFVLVAVFDLSMDGIAAAEAGTPYWCDCKGTKKRFIGGSRGCETDRERAAGTTYSGGLFKYRRCTAHEFSAWRASACKSNGCKPVRY